MSFQQFAQPLIAKYSKKEWPITTAMAEGNRNEYISYFDNQQSREILGIRYHDWSRTMLDMAKRMIELGHIKKPKTRQMKSHPS